MPLSGGRQHGIARGVSGQPTPRAGSQGALADASRSSGEQGTGAEALRKVGQIPCAVLGPIADLSVF